MGQIQLSLRGARRAAVLGMLALVAACSRERGTEPLTIVPNAHVTATVAGEAFAANYQVGLAVGDVFPSLERLEIVGLELAPTFAGRQVTIVVNGFDGPGTYTIGDPMNGQGTFAFWVTSPDVRAAPSVREETDLFYETTAEVGGSITVTSYDDEEGIMAGTFAFSAVNQDDEADVVSVTGGAFMGRVLRGQ